MLVLDPLFENANFFAESEQLIRPTEVVERVEDTAHGGVVLMDGVRHISEGLTVDNRLVDYVDPLLMAEDPRQLNIFL